MADQPIIIKKKIVAGHGHHGGSWKVAYADFVTAMMAFFMVMWLVNLSDDTKNQIQGYFNDPLGFANTQSKSRSLMMMDGTAMPKPGAKKKGEARKDETKQFHRVEQKLKEKISADPKFKDLIQGIKISVTEKGLLMELMETKGAVFFESGSAEIRPKARELIDSVAPILKSAHHPMEVQGYTDAQPFQGATGNWGLSSQRANALQAALFSNGITDFTQVTGFGASHLLDPEHPLASCNRRVTILLPRKYDAVGSIQEPADALRAAMDTAHLPEAVMVKPELPEIKDKPKR